MRQFGVASISQSPVSRPKAEFDVEAFLHSPGRGRTLLEYRPGSVLYAQDDPGDTVLHVVHGGVRLSVLSRTGKQAIVATLGPGDFVGEVALVGRPHRMETATAMLTTTALVIEKAEMLRVLHEQPAFSDRFITYMLSRSVRLEADLADQLFNQSEKRLARALLLLARYGKPDGPRRVLPQISQEVLAEMIGTTRSRVNFFMNKFRKFGFIEYSGDLKINGTLLSAVLHDSAPAPARIERHRRRLAAVPPGFATSNWAENQSLEA